MTQKSRNSLFARIGAVEPAPPWGVSGVVVAFAAALFLILIAGPAVALAWLGDPIAAVLPGWLIGSVLTILFVLQTRRRDRQALRLGAGTTPLPFIMFIGVGFAIAFDLLGLALTGQFLPVPELLALPDRSALNWLLVIAFMLVAQPIAEELVFRGVGFPVLRAILGGWGGLVTSAALYAIFHMLAYPPNYANAAGITPIWYGLALPFLDGLVISAVRAYTGSTRAAIAAHAAFSLFAIVKLIAI